MRSFRAFRVEKTEDRQFPRSIVERDIADLPPGDLLIDGASLGKVLVPAPVSNVCFGRSAKHRLFVTASTSVHSVVLNREGVQRP